MRYKRICKQCGRLGSSKRHPSKLRQCCSNCWNYPPRLFIVTGIWTGNDIKEVTQSTYNLYRWGGIVYANSIRYKEEQCFTKRIDAVNYLKEARRVSLSYAS